jgi:hypothetical protein
MASSVFGWMDLEGEANPLGLEHVHDRPPALAEVVVPPLDGVPVVGRERVEHVPDRRAREAGHHLHAEPSRRTRGVLHLLGRSPADALGVAVPPHVLGQYRPVPLVDRVADRLPDEVCADRPAVEAVALEQLAPGAHVALVRERLVDLEVVAPGSQLEAIEAPFAAFRGQGLEREVGPLAGEQGYGSCHCRSSQIAGCGGRYRSSISAGKSA